MRKQAATEAEGGQKVKIRGAGGVTNRLPTLTYLR